MLTQIRMKSQKPAFSSELLFLVQSLLRNNFVVAAVAVVVFVVAVGVVDAVIVVAVAVSVVVASLAVDAAVVE